MSPDSGPIHIARGRGGEVDVEGSLDAFAGQILLRAGFLFEPSLRGHWIRLPFDMGRDWENERSTWAAEMLTAARYAVHLDPGLDTRPTPLVTSSGPDRTPPAMPPQRTTTTARRP
ncbi:hypothetical protein ACIF80_36200 [Streptomyces sp. NPDC085927]|uniref:hypothetical protein n=1 Tax=Streptomyces sp. NPDC085927 TaxID=3365738 RepID=UPI0037CCC4EF